MAISFPAIPANVLVPLFYADITPAQEPFQPSLKMLLIGHMNRGVDNQEGGAEQNVLYQLTRDEARDLFGRGSMLDWMYTSARQNAPWAEIWAIAIPEIEGPTAVAATGSITCVVGGTGGTAKKPYVGSSRLYVAGRAVDYFIREGDTSEKIAIQVAAAINREGLPMKAVVDVTDKSLVNLSCRWKGPSGVDIRMSWTGPADRAEHLSQPIKNTKKYLRFVQLTGGTGEAAVQATFDAIGDTPFDVFCFPLVSQLNLDLCRDFMDHEEGRWSPFQQLYGHMVTAQNAIYDNLYALGEARNDPHMTILGIKQSIIPPWCWAAALAGVMISHWVAPPELSRPLQTLTLKGISVGTGDEDSFTKLERHRLLAQGISTFHVNRDNSVAIDRVRTLRKYNAYEDPDASWADAITMFQAQYFVRAMRAAIQGAFPRAALTNADTAINGFCSPNQIRMVVLHEYQRMVSLGLVENFSLFAQYLVVERNAVDRNRVDMLMRPDFVNQLRVVAVLVETHLELTNDFVLQDSAALAA